MSDHGPIADDGRPVAEAPPNEELFEPRPDKPTWTHIALRVRDIDASIEWYERYTPLRLLEKRQDELGFGCWLGDPDSVERPFILVLAQFLPETDPFKDAPQEILAPFAHLGIEVPTQDDVDAAAVVGREGGCLGMPPMWLPAPVGYVCMLRDPDGNMVEFSFNQGVYATAKETWGRVDAT